MKEALKMADDKKLKNQSKNNNPKEEQEKEHNGLAIGMCLGVALGLSLGQLLYHNMSLGLCFGLGIGLCLGTAYDAMKNKKKADGADQEATNQQNAEAEPEEKKPESGEE